MAKRKKESLSREVIVIYFILILLAIIIIRLIFIQLYSANDFAEQAVAQRIKINVLENNRGQVYDRHGKAFTNDDEKRYNDNGVLRHVIGKINNENVGESGLERKFEKILKSDGNERSVFLIGSNSQVIKNYGIIGNKINGNNIETTIDYDIQVLTEEIMDQYIINGAIVVTEVKTGEIISMASRPNMKQVNSQIGSDNVDYMNKAVNSYNLGSVFKIITMAAYMEDTCYDENKKSICDGGIQISDTYIKCSASNAHRNREISLTEAMAYSCNSAFIDIAMQVGAEKIITMAKSFGLGELCAIIYDGKNVINTLSEAIGKLPEIADGISNIAIGQGSLLVSPLQVNNILSIIANNGIKKQLRIISTIINDKDKNNNNIEYKKDERVISESTAKKIQLMLYTVTEYGSGKLANMNEHGGSAGKTGSAEAANATHAWFAGYFPYENPLYAITVLICDGKSGGKKAAPIFKELAIKILK